MKIIHTSDWHLGQDFYNFDRKEEHLYFFQQLNNLVRLEQPDVMVVCGDIYHTATPSNAATKLYTEQMVALHESCPTMQMVVIAGNHDSCSRLESTGEVWRLAQVTVVGGIERDEISNDWITERHIIEIPDKGFIIAVPFINEKNYPIFTELQKVVENKNTKSLPVVMTGHLAVTGTDFTGHEILMGGITSEPLANLGKGYDYLALGHIHCPQTLKESNDRARYSGSPLPVNFDEKYPHSVSVVNINHHQDTVDIKEVHIQPLYHFFEIPQNAMPLEDALNALQQFNDTTLGYVRINVLVKDFVPVDAQLRIQEIMQLKKNLRYCNLNQIREKTTVTNERQKLNTQEIKTMNPLELAKIFYQEKYGDQINADEERLLSEVIDNVKNEESNH
ncbi:MAG: exonuclease SbcCD subunit D [Bacteroidales bacterium]|nr:exonuclease SbcCD subunit D [Bacteroidales bacterium]